MPENDDLLQQIQSLLGVAVTPTLTKTKNVADLFEAYIFSLVIQAARVEGAIIDYRTVNGSKPSDFVFRTSPGHLYSCAQPYSHAMIQFTGKPTLEAHLGIKLSGRSKVLHEADVAIIRYDEAVTCRAHKVPPRSSKVILVIECKFYSSCIPLNLARAFMGLETDLSAQDCYFVVNTWSDSAEKLLSHHKRKWEHHIVPGSHREIERLRNLLQDTFKNFKAKN